jgi:hypothetical protein
MCGKTRRSWVFLVRVKIDFGRHLVNRGGACYSIRKGWLHLFSYLLWHRHLIVPFPEAVAMDFHFAESPDRSFGFEPTAARGP